jgi:hypothetical protein
MSTSRRSTPNAAKLRLSFTAPRCKRNIGMGGSQVRLRPGRCNQVSCRMTITKIMMTSTPMMVPITPRFMEGPPLAPIWGYPQV